jgi:predicted  nucleic acid-binding Zn-ribbon protein
MISRDWQCMACGHTFHSYDGNPACPKCGCVRVQWVPGGGHVRKHAGVDATVRSLAESYGMSDINTPSPSRLNRAMPKYDAPKADGPTLNFAPGFAAPFHTGGRATCEPSQTRVDFKVRTAPEAAIPQAQHNYPGLGSSHWLGIRRPYRS